MDEIELLYERLKLTQKDIKQSIDYAYESDDCTQCYSQGLQDALAMSEWLFDTIEELYAKHQKESKLTSNAVASDNQLKLFGE